MSPTFGEQATRQSRAFKYFTRQNLATTYVSQIEVKRAWCTHRDLPLDRYRKSSIRDSEPLRSYDGCTGEVVPSCRTPLR
jgi:hypothetical protein